MDIQWEFISGNVYDDTIQTYLKHCSLNEGEITTIALCFESSELNASVCLALPVEICKTAVPNLPPLIDKICPTLKGIGNCASDGG